MRSWPLATAVLPAGFAVADLTGVRPLGGAVLVAGGLATVAASDADPKAKRLWGGITFAAFVASHVLSHAIGAWPAVACVAAVAGYAGYVLLDRRALTPRPA